VGHADITILQMLKSSMYAFCDSTLSLRTVNDMLIDCQYHLTKNQQDPHSCRLPAGPKAAVDNGAMPPGCCPEGLYARAAPHAPAEPPACEAGPAARGPVAALALFPAPLTEAFAPVLPPKLGPGAALPKAGLLTLLELPVRLPLLLVRVPLLLPVRLPLLPVRLPLLPVRLSLLPVRLPLLPFSSPLLPVRSLKLPTSPAAGAPLPAGVSPVALAPNAPLFTPPLSDRPASLLLPSAIMPDPRPTVLVPVAFALAAARAGELSGDRLLELFALNDAPAAAAAMPEDRELLTAGEGGGGGGMLTTALGDMGEADAELLTGLALRPAFVGDGVGVVAAAGLVVPLAEADPGVADAAWPAAVLLTSTGSGDISSDAPALAFAAVTPLTRGEP